MTTDHLQQSIRFLEQEIEAIDERRGEIMRAIDALRPFVPALPDPKPRRTPRSPVNVGAPAKAEGKAGAILAELRKKSPRAPSELAKAVGLNSSTALLYHAKALLKAKTIVVVGSGGHRQYTLPGQVPAKEGL